MSWPRRIRQICKGCGHAEHIGMKCRHQIPTGVLDNAPVWLRMQYSMISLEYGTACAQQWHRCYCEASEVFTRVAS